MSEEIQKQTILIIDDSIADIKVLGSTLQPDYKILFALNAQKGITSVIDNHPDIILLDIIMPGMDGYEACRQLKADERTWDIPIIFITAKTGEKDELKGFELGASDYITKPFDPVIVKARVRTHIALRLATIDLKSKMVEYQIINRALEQEITERKQVERELEGYREHLEDIVNERTAELEKNNIKLAALNTTLEVLLKKREDDKNAIEEMFVMNIKNMVLPYVEQMQKGRLDVGQKTQLQIIQTLLQEITTPLMKNLRHFNFTPKELKVATLVKQGKPTKEIAEILGLASGSVDVHRKNIRKKLGLSNKNANLQSHLDSLGSRYFTTPLFIRKYTVDVLANLSIVRRQMFLDLHCL